MWDDPQELETGQPTGTSSGGETTKPEFGMPATGNEMNIYNRREIQELIGPDRAERRLRARWDAEKLNEAYRNDCVYVTVAAVRSRCRGQKTEAVALADADQYRLARPQPRIAP